MIDIKVYWKLSLGSESKKMLRVHCPHHPHFLLHWPLHHGRTRATCHRGMCGEAGRKPRKLRGEGAVHLIFPKTTRHKQCSRDHCRGLSACELHLKKFLVWQQGLQLWASLLPGNGEPWDQLWLLSKYFHQDAPSCGTWVAQSLRICLRLRSWF